MEKDKRKRKRKKREVGKMREFREALRVILGVDYWRPICYHFT
jgi:hypothetical protein